MPDETALSFVERILFENKELEGEHKRDMLLYEFCIPYQDFLDEWYKKSYGKEFTASFTENWLEFLKVKTRGVSDERAEKILGEAFNLASAVAYTVMEKFARKPKKNAPDIGPYSHFREDLGYDDSDFDVLRGTLRDPPNFEEFDKNSFVYECLDNIIS